MLNQLIAAIILLLIQNASEIIYYTCAIFDFPILTQYLFHNNEIFFYIYHALYKLDPKKIMFENYCLINAKLFQPTFNYSKFHTMTYFVKCI